MVANKNKAKTMTKHVPCDSKCNSIVNLTIQIKNGIMKHQYECEKYSTCKKDYSCNLSPCICENSKYLKIITDTSVI